MYNWNTLNQKVFKKIGFTLTKKDMDDIVNCVPDTVERVLKAVQIHVKKVLIVLDKALSREKSQESIRKHGRI